MTEHDMIKLDGEEMEVKEFNLNLRGIQELFRSWSQSLMIDSLKKDIDITARAKKALAVMDDILEELKEKKKIDILEVGKDTDLTGKSFKERAWLNFLKKNYERTNWYYSQVHDLASGINDGAKGDFDAAKQIMIGTIVGNYQKKLNALKNITPQHFSKLKQEFKKIYEQVKLEEDSDPQKGSLYSIFSDSTFMDGLKNCKNPIDLVENFPLSGVHLKINKNLNTDSVWNIAIQEAYNMKMETDQPAVIKNNGAVIVKKNEKNCSVNCFLPLLE